MTDMEIEMAELDNPFSGHDCDDPYALVAVLAPETDEASTYDPRVVFSHPRDDATRS